MWFRNLLVYRLTQNINLNAEALEAALATKPARACANQEMVTYGFVAPVGKGPDAPLVHSTNGFLLIAARKEERILPGSVVRDALQEKVEEIEAEQMRKVYKKERDQLKDEIVQAFLPRAFIRKSVTYAAIDVASNLIYVDASSSNKAEDILSTMREAIGSLPVRPISVKIAPTATLTDWLKTGQASEGFFVLDECELRDTHEDGGVVRCKRQDLTSEEIQLHLSSGKQVTQLAIAWSDKLSFVLDSKLTIKRLRFEDLLQDQAAQDGGDDAAGQLDASFNLMMLTLQGMMPALLEGFGGEEIPQGLGTEAPANVETDDPLYDQAVSYVLTSRRAGVSAVQRSLNIGYNRAARLLELMEAAGVVSAASAEGRRSVLMAPPAAQVA